MLEINVKKVDFEGKNTIISRVVNLDNQLDLILLISVKDTSFWDLFLNKILDSIIDRISKKDTYKDFSTALENINAFLYTWKNENDKLKGVHAVIGILQKNQLLFSTLGSPSCYLVNNHNDVIEVTEKEESRKDFDFISSGEFNDGEIVVFGTTRILNYLSKGDMLDGARLDDVQWFNENIQAILQSEGLKKNIGVIAFRNNAIVTTYQENTLSDWMYRGMQFLDNNIVKTVISYWILFKKKFISQSKQSKNIIFLGWMIVCFVMLYTVLSGFMSLSSWVRDTEESKENLLKAREYVRLASENINNPDMFSLYISDGETLVTDIKEKELFLNDVSKILDDISILKKQFNGIETFAPTEEGVLFESGDLQKPVKVVSVSNKVFIIDSTSIIGPVISGQIPEVFPFEQLTEGDYFIDAAVQDTNIILLTSLGKIVNFAKNNFFSYVDVEDQPTWEESNILSSYASNIYLLGKQRNQIFRHRKSAGKYQEGVPYLAEEDSQAIGVILSMAIDGGIYILKKDLSLAKLFVSPKYRLETITLNGLPKNYDREWDDSRVFIYTANNLNYFYMLLNNRVLVFQPNTTRYQDVKSMTYVWQVEARDFDIQDFFVANDGEIFLLGEKGLYKMKFEISDEKLIVR